MNKYLTALLLLAGAEVFAQPASGPINTVNFSQVKVTDPFWKGRMETVATSTLQACMLYTETKTARIRNFENAAAKKGKHEGIYFDDSDVYKAIEAMAYSLKNHPDAEVERKADEWISKIAAAQLPDGYINTYYQLTGLDKRWTDMEKHEDYCAGHLIEAAVAYYNTTGKKQLLDVAMKMADHIDTWFRQSGKHWVSGHQEIELALMRLYHLTGQRKYLDMAQWFLDQRGYGYGKGVIWDEWKDPDYCQDGTPVKEQRQITGHAVRAMYLYTGAADVAAVTNDQGYMTAMKAVWDDVINRNLYITGGIGAQGKNEGFGVDYDLPNLTAYCETCASVGMVFWNQRMHALTGEGKYTDVLERSLYNGALDGLSLSGDHFFYGNPLASSGNYARREWFGTACCPSNIARLVASLGNYIYSVSPGAAWVNLYIGSAVSLPFGKEKLDLSLTTGFPWNGRTTIAVGNAPRKSMQLRLRIPGWLSTPVAGDLYHFTDTLSDQMVIKVNGKPQPFLQDNGYAVIDRKWKRGDSISIETPMRARWIQSNTALRENTDRVALQYGPLVYCVEGADNGGNAWNFIIPPAAKVVPGFEPQLLGGVNRLSIDGKVAAPADGGTQIRWENKTIYAIPFFSWNNRGAGEMQVWLPTAVHSVKINE
ncbi:glycoside hydrolase family 127 protein [Flavihumibacter petaseus]|uniref:Glycoside hydrolase family 127 protein n=1 Tax=Flavihumibacter petaseus NBRC 106054 TaxID=1220578 RepID=A0A0E9MXV0_9BACT|nr:beta-L-arabinofuranosidase domain-containing protein [Flavihumibacter petaseus]GAO42404.1 hypothetical protein FPE01S_01_14190 [Flavihumibacter petaseus NBRC 106054]